MEFTYNVDMFKETFETSFTYLQGFMRNVHRFGGHITEIGEVIIKSPANVRD